MACTHHLERGGWDRARNAPEGGVACERAGPLSGLSGDLGLLLAPRPVADQKCVGSTQATLFQFITLRSTHAAPLAP